MRRSHFEFIAAEYNSSLPWHVMCHYLEKRARLVEQLIPRGGLIADVGCGTGLLAKRLAEAGYEVIGLDEAHAMLRQMQVRGSSNTMPIQANGTQLPLLSATFDGVISVATLHHVAERSAVAAVIAEMVRIARPGGVCIIWDHNPLNPYWPTLMRRVPQDTGEERLIPAKEILRDLDQAGAHRHRLKRSGFVPDFVPPWLLGLFQAIEYVVERLPGLNLLCAHNVVIVEK